MEPTKKESAVRLDVAETVEPEQKTQEAKHTMRMKRKEKGNDEKDTRSFAFVLLGYCLFFMFVIVVGDTIVSTIRDEQMSELIPNTFKLLEILIVFLFGYMFSKDK
ncbi:MAG: hypothetical protein LBM16_01100 [Clostridiales bacterium]|jgi:hypothetical protein|nr:hypothetical protein [Clostridiales bacterium]